MKKFAIDNLGASSCSSILVQSLEGWIQHVSGRGYVRFELNDEKTFWGVWDRTMETFDEGPGCGGDHELSDFAFLIFYTIQGMPIEDTLKEIGCFGQTEKADKTGSTCTLWTIKVSDFEKARAKHVLKSESK